MSSADQLAGVVWRRRPTFLISFICVLAAAAAIIFTLPKGYSTDAYLVVNARNNNSTDYTAQQIAQVETQTVAELLNTRNVADQVAAQLPFAETGQGVQSDVSISPVSSTQLVLISASGSTPRRAQELANTYARVFVGSLAPAVGSAQIAIAAHAPLITAASSPRTHVFLIAGALLALLAGVGAALQRERLDRRLHVDEFATEILGLPILASVSEVGGRRRGAELKQVRFAENFRWVFANLAFVSGGEAPRALAVVSSGEQEGKTTVAIALANAAAEIVPGGVLLVDADLRRPMLEARLGVPEPLEPGLAGYLADPEAEGTVRSMARRVPNSPVGLIPAGTPPPRPASLFGLPRFKAFVEDVREMCDLAVFDTPPVAAGADAALVATNTDGAVLVIDARGSQRPAVEWSLEQLRRARVNILGVVINRSRQPEMLTGYYDSGADGGRGGHRRRRRRRAAGPSVAQEAPSREASPALSRD